jgi:hypothetical protein
MKGHFITGFSLAAISAVVSTTAFADGGQGIGRAGTYLTQTDSTGTKTRAEVRAELAAAYSNGTLPALNRNAYPERSLTGEVIAAQQAKRARDAAIAEERNRGIVEYATGAAGSTVR